MMDLGTAFSKMGIVEIMDAAAKFQLMLNQTGKLSSDAIKIGIPLYERMEQIATNPEIKIMAQSRLTWLKESAAKLNGDNVIDFSLWKITHKKKKP